MRKIETTHAVHAVGLAAVTVLAVLVTAGCASPPPPPVASEQPSEQSTPPAINYDVQELDNLSRTATMMLRQYLSEYGLGEQAESVVLTASPAASMDMLAQGGSVVLITSFELLIDGVLEPAYTATATASGSTMETAERDLAWYGSGIIGDPLIAWLSKRGYDYEAESLGGYGFYLTSLFGRDEDDAKLQEWASDMVKTARAILAAAEPVLLERLPPEADSASPGEPVGILQFMLMGTDVNPSGRVSVSALFDDSGQLSAALNAGVSWPDVRGFYSVSIGYGLM